MLSLVTSIITFLLFRKHVKHTLVHANQYSTARFVPVRISYILDSLSFNLFPSQHR